MEPTDITVKILTEIRDAVRETNARLDRQGEQLAKHTDRIDALGVHLDALGGRVDALGGRVDALGDRVVEGEIRTATAITALAGTLNDVKHLLQDRLDLSGRLGRCEADIALLKERTGLRQAPHPPPGPDRQTP